MKKEVLTVELPEGENLRIDKYLADVIQMLTRSRIKQQVASLLVNEEQAKLSKQVKAGDRVEVLLLEQPPQVIEPEPIPLDILYEDDSLIVVNKDQGVVVHPAQGNYHGTLIQGIMHYCLSLSKSFPDQRIRPGIVHRLDKDTSGVVLVAKNPHVLEHVSLQFRKRSIEKGYLAIVKGTPFPLEETIETFIVRDKVHRKRFSTSESEGKKAVTSYKVLKRFDSYSFIKLVPKTGRTHQLRVHMQQKGTPIVGDPLYARKDAAFPEETLLLHAYKLTIKMPDSGVQKKFRAPLPARFKKMIRILAGMQ
jgi:23S rRNA pseudouridine1911/1915/1917 synthase